MTYYPFHNPNDFWSHDQYDPYHDMNDDERFTVVLIHAAIFLAAAVAGIALAGLIDLFVE